MSDFTPEDRPAEAPTTPKLEVDAPDFAVEPDEQAVHDHIMGLQEGQDAKIIGFPAEPGDEALLDDPASDDVPTIGVIFDPDDPDSAVVQLPSPPRITQAELDELANLQFPEPMPVFGLEPPADPATTPAMTPLGVTYPPPGTVPDPDDPKLTMSRSDRRKLLGQDPRG